MTKLHLLCHITKVTAIPGKSARCSSKVQLQEPGNWHVILPSTHIPLSQIHYDMKSKTPEPQEQPTAGATVADINILPHSIYIYIRAHMYKTIYTHTHTNKCHCITTAMHVTGKVQEFAPKSRIHLQIWGYLTVPTESGGEGSSGFYYFCTRNNSDILSPLRLPTMTATIPDMHWCSRSLPTQPSLCIKQNCLEVIQTHPDEVKAIYKQRWLLIDNLLKQWHYKTEEKTLKKQTTRTPRKCILSN